MAADPDLLRQEYVEINGHLRANIAQFVNWFSFFLVFSFLVAAVFLLGRRAGPAPHSLAFDYGVPVVFLVMHVLAFVGILMFRRYISAAHCRLEEIIRETGSAGASPIPARFCKWMTGLMAAGYVISYLTWHALIFVR